ncbi:hypothetical protein [Neobacillus dielmonensis]|uniref:hypothetical protein n=1 Tax=Neobacillus dielmonensis TaxID=1347369 RepID=UPI000A488AA2|nr:hypothetical protein [Neobacillus dielmonensis]
MIKDIEEKYDGTLIIPMTIVNPNYFKEIIGLLTTRRGGGTPVYFNVRKRSAAPKT